MKLRAYKNPVTIGQILTELKGYEKKYSSFDVVCWASDDNTLCVVGAGLDKDGDLRIELDEMGDEGGGFSVSDLLAALKEYDKDTRVYMAGCGLYLNFELNHDGSIFSESSEEDELVGCHATIFGKYKEDPTEKHTEAEKRNQAEKASAQKRENRIYSLVLAVISIGVLCWLIYNIYALIVPVGRPVWTCILWIVLCIVILVVCGGTLYHSKDK